MLCQINDLYINNINVNNIKNEDDSNKYIYHRTRFSLSSHTVG